MTNHIIEPVSGVPESSGTKTYGYTNGLVTTITWVNAAGVFVKNMSYNGDGTLAGSSQWVKQ